MRFPFGARTIEMKIILTKTPRSSTHIRFITKEGASVIPDFQGEKGAIAVRYVKNDTDIYAGLGEQAKCSIHIVRATAAQAIRRAIELKRERVALVLPTRRECADTHAPAASLEGALMGIYSFSRYKSEKPVRIETLECSGAGLSVADLRRIESIVAAVNYARDLTNENADTVYPETLAREARRIAQTGGMRITVLDEKQILAKKMGLLSAVGRGSPYPPRLIALDYAGDPRSSERTAIVGKGVTFDSGGYNLKPTGSLEDMKHDMAGAAAVLGIMQALAALKAKVNVVGIIPAAHNALDGRSYFPGDVYTSLAGKTIEITNTDAEGRLILADAITWCQKTYRPARLIDLATLTGGILTALGEYVAGLFSNTPEMADALFRAGERTFERVWNFPLYDEYADSMKSDIADLRNTSKFKKGYASSITGAAFIREFIEDIPWAHIDIAGTAWNASEPRGEIPKYATGFGVRLVLSFLEV